jgi:hypothetical protein
MLRALAALFATALTTAVGAATLNWQGGTGDLTSSNWIDSTTSAPNLAPGVGNALNVGANGTGTYATNTGSLSTLKFFVGHNITPNTGAGTVIINDGTINATGGDQNAINAGIMIGNAANGTVIMNGGTLTSNRLLNVGYGASSTLKGYLNVGTNAFVSTQVGDLLIGAGTGNGLGGTMIFSGSGSISGNLTVGSVRGSSYTQNFGSLTVGGTVIVGQSDNSTSAFTMSSGTIVCTAFSQSNGSSARATSVDISGDAYIITTPVVTTGHNFTIGDAANTVGAVFNLSGNATVVSGNRFLMGSSAVVNKDLAHAITVNQSGGTLSTALDVRLGDVSGYTVYNLSGGTILTNTGILVSRRGIGRMFQTNGTAIAAGSAGLRIGDSEDGANLVNDGLYQISGGTLTATSIALANNGTGTLAIIGGDATITGSGNFTAKAVSGSTTSALTFKLEPGESLTEVVMNGVSSTATFAAGTFVTIDDAGTTPTQFSYDLLTATAITNNGLIFQAPANWTLAIEPGGSGQVLRAYVPEPSSLALVGLAALAMARRPRRRVA